MDYFDDGGERVRSPLGHTDHDRAKAQADDLAAQFRRQAARPAKLTLAKLFDIYDREVTCQKGESKRKHDRRTAEMMLRYFGPDCEPRTLSRREWDRFIDARRRGEVRPKKAPKRTVGDRMVEYDLKFLLAVLNWATVASDGRAGVLLERNPLKGLPLPSERNPKRPALTPEQYKRMLLAADAVHALLRALLVIAHETGHRIGSIRHLRRNDIDTEQRIVTWRPEHDKTGVAHQTPLTEGAIAVLSAQRRAEARIGDGWLFPDPRHPEKPVTRHTLNSWWRRCAKSAQLPTGQRVGWHSLRRTWASEMRDASPRDLCDLGGWSTYDVPLKCYIKPSIEAQRAALAQRREIVTASGA
jgi:integrase